VIKVTDYGDGQGDDQNGRLGSCAAELSGRESFDVSHYQKKVAANMTSSLLPLQVAAQLPALSQFSDLSRRNGQTDELSLGTAAQHETNR